MLVRENKIKTARDRENEKITKILGQIFYNDDDDEARNEQLSRRLVRLAARRALAAVMNKFSIRN